MVPEDARVQMKSDPRRSWKVVLGAILGATSGCSFILDLEEGRPCDLDSQCEFVQGAGVCDDGKCRLAEVAQGTSMDSDPSSTGTGLVTMDEGASDDICATQACVPETGSGSTSADTEAESTGIEVESTGTSEPPPPGCDPSPALSENPLIDDFEDRSIGLPAIDGRKGLWYSSNDTTGTQPNGLVFFDGGAEGSDVAGGTTIDGFTGWGAAIGVRLNSTAGSVCPYNASEYDGIQFWARGSGQWRFMVSTSDTVDLGSGGTCVSGCDDHFGADFTLGPTWTAYQYLWGALDQAGWGTPADLQPNEVNLLQWLNEQPGTFELQLDEVSFVSMGG